MYSKLFLFFLFVFVNTQEWHPNGPNGNALNCYPGQEIIALRKNVHQFLSSGQQKLGALSAKLSNFALFWNSTKEQAIVDLIHGFAAFKDQADSVSADLQITLTQLKNKANTASGEERARLECGITLLTTDLDLVKAANDRVPNDTRLQAPYEKVQEELKHVLDNFSTTDCPSFDYKISTLLAKVKSISDEGVYYGTKRIDELKAKLEAEKQKEYDDLDKIESLQNQYKDRVLHLLSFLVPEQTNVKNLITKAEELLKTVEERKKTCLILSIDKLKKLSIYFEEQINNLWPRLLNL